MWHWIVWPSLHANPARNMVHAWCSRLDDGLAPHKIYKWFLLNYRTPLGWFETITRVGWFETITRVTRSSWTQGTYIRFNIITWAHLKASVSLGETVTWIIINIIFISCWSYLFPLIRNWAREQVAIGWGSDRHDTYNHGNMWCIYCHQQILDGNIIILGVLSIGSKLLDMNDKSRLDFRDSLTMFMVLWELNDELRDQSILGWCHLRNTDWRFDF